MFDTPTAANLSDHALEDGVPRRWSKLLARMVDAVCLDLVRTHPDPVQRFELAMRVILAISKDCGGRNIYLPQGRALELALRDARIWQLFADCGWHVEDIATEFEITDRTVRSAIAEQRALRMPRIQPDLFATPPDSFGNVSRPN